MIRPAPEQTRLPKERGARALREIRPRDLLFLLALGAAALLVAGRVVSAHETTGDGAALPAVPNARVTSASQYPIPAVRLVRDDGKVVLLPEELNDGRPVVLNFIFTTCSSTCPLMSQTFAQFDSELGADRERVQLMSISTDPEQEHTGTAARVRAEIPRRSRVAALHRHARGEHRRAARVQRVARGQDEPHADHVAAGRSRHALVADRGVRDSGGAAAALPSAARALRAERGYTLSQSELPGA